MLRIVKDGLPGWAHFGAAAQSVTGVGIAVPTGEIRACHIQADAVSRLENVGSCPEIDSELIRLARFEQFGLVTVSVARPDNPVRQVLSETVRVNIHQRRYKIGVSGV